MRAELALDLTKQLVLFAFIFQCSTYFFFPLDRPRLQIGQPSTCLSELCRIQHQLILKCVEIPGNAEYITEQDGMLF